MSNDLSNPAAADSSNTFAPETGFNIAAAFPVTDDIVRRVRIQRLRHQVAAARDLLSRPAVRWSLAAALTGLFVAGWAKRHL